MLIASSFANHTASAQSTQLLSTVLFLILQAYSIKGLQAQSLPVTLKCLFASCIFLFSNTTYPYTHALTLFFRSTLLHTNR